MSFLLVAAPHSFAHFVESQHLFSDSRALALPFLICGYYFVVWILVGRDRAAGTIQAIYEPPAGMSAATARFVFTGGRVDRKTVAAVLMQMEADGVVTVTPQRTLYLVRRMGRDVPTDPDQQRVYEVLFPNDAANPSGDTACIDPDDATQMLQLSSQLQQSVGTRLQGRYFSRNVRWIALAVLASLVWSLKMAYDTPGDGAFFMTLWFFLFSLGLGAITAGAVVPALFDLFRGELAANNAMKMLLPLPIFFALPLAVCYHLGAITNFAFAEMLLATTVLHIVWGVLLKAPTVEGAEALRQLLCFREFLMTVEQDRLDRINDPEARASLVDRYLPYAIALDLR